MAEASTQTINSLAVGSVQGAAASRKEKKEDHFGTSDKSFEAQRTREQRSRRLSGDTVARALGIMVGLRLADTSKRGMALAGKRKELKKAKKMIKGNVKKGVEGSPAALKKIKKEGRSTKAKSFAHGASYTLAGGVAATIAYRGGKKAVKKIKPRIVSYKKKLDSGRMITVKRRSNNKKRR